MVKSGQDVSPVGFNSSVHERLPVEVDDCSRLVGRVGRSLITGPQRPSFDLLLVPRLVGGSHEIDFEMFDARPGRLLRVRAGQVHAWQPDDPIDGRVVMSGPGTSTPQPWFPGDVPVADLDASAAATANTIVDELERQQQAFEPTDATVRVMVSLFDVLVGLFDQHVDRDATAVRSPVYLAFRTAVEEDPTPGRDVASYARRIGYSPRTVTRACLAATGQTAKQILIDGVVLRAKRRLARSDAPIAAIALELGFSEATNFTKFFVRETGSTPLDFRRSQRPG